MTSAWDWLSKWIKWTKKAYQTVADPGGAAGARPQGSRFFHFDIRIFQNVVALGVGAPLREILDPSLPNGISSHKQLRNNHNAHLFVTIMLQEVQTEIDLREGLQKVPQQKPNRKWTST